ncbi:hypothetical protein ACMGE9_04145 [Macrococcus sp. EM39E]|uniref:hypothetical protein n=1 Tax=Macrococcus animalis TaxID=3395467 RepID=UPI0039BDBEEA
MKKLFSFCIALILLFTLTIDVNAALKKPSVPNLKSKTAIQTMKKGTFKLNGIKIGNTYGYVKQKWVKPSFKVNSLYQRYDFEYHYLTERGDNTILYFQGKRGDKPEQYRLRSISFAGIPQYFTVSDMNKYWGEGDLYYPQAETINYIQGNALLSFDINGSLTYVAMLHKEDIKEILIKFAF